MVKACELGDRGIVWTENSLEMSPPGLSPKEHVYVHISIITSDLIWICISLCRSIWVCTCICTCICLCICICVRIHIYVCVCTPVHVHTHVRVFISNRKTRTS